MSNYGNLTVSIFDCPGPRNLPRSEKNKGKWDFFNPWLFTAHTECQALNHQPEAPQLILNEFVPFWFPRVLFSVQNNRLHEQLANCILLHIADINEMWWWFGLIFDSYSPAVLAKDFSSLTSGAYWSAASTLPPPRRVSKKTKQLRTLCAVRVVMLQINKDVKRKTLLLAWI